MYLSVSLLKTISSINCKYYWLRDGPNQDQVITFCTIRSSFTFSLAFENESSCIKHFDNLLWNKMSGEKIENILFVKVLIMLGFKVNYLLPFPLQSWVQHDFWSSFPFQSWVQHDFQSSFPFQSWVRHHFQFPTMNCPALETNWCIELPNLTTAQENKIWKMYYQ